MEQLIRSFGLDWKLLLAQVLNFAVLIFVLNRFVFRPLVGVLKRRREEIDKGIAFTKKAEENLKSADLIKESAVKEAKDKALSIVTAAEVSANDRKSEILSEAEQKKESVIAEAKGIIDEHKNKMLEGVYASAEGLVKIALQKIFAKMSPSERDNNLIKEALREARENAR